MRNTIYDDYIKIKVIVRSGERIINKGDIVTEDKLKMLDELNLLETDNFDYRFSASIF